MTSEEALAILGWRIVDCVGPVWALLDETGRQRTDYGGEEHLGYYFPDSFIPGDFGTLEAAIQAACQKLEIGNWRAYGH